jgi:hypothetical protein
MSKFASAYGDRKYATSRATLSRQLGGSNAK